MDVFPTLTPGGVTLVIGLPTPEPLPTFIARLAQQGPVQVMVGGNRFDAQHLARLVRRHTVQVDAVLERGQVVRPFTCYQTTTFLQQHEDAVPLVVLDMLAPFSDDNISDRESARLAAQAAAHLHRCGQHTSMLVTAHPLAATARQEALAIIQAVADQVITYQPPPAATQLSLW